jgi:hypothetical protein
MRGSQGMERVETIHQNSDPTVKKKSTAAVRFILLSIDGFA